MIEARAADGSVHRFPADTPDEVVDRAMQTYATEQRRTTTAREANSGALGYVGGLSRQALQGLTFGLGDEALAGIQTGAGIWGNYGEALAGERARNTEFRDSNPIASTVANVGGAVAFPAAAMGRAGVALGGMIPPAAPTAGMLERLMRSGVARGSLAGATGGAAAGAGEGEGLDGRLVGAAQGAALGTLAGGAFGAGVSAIGGIGGRLLNATGLRNPEVMADRQMIRAFGRDGIDPATLQGLPQGPGLAPAADGMALVDRGGRNVGNLAAVASNTPGDAMQAADVLMQARRNARPERIAGAVDDGFGGGGGGDIAETVERLGQQRSTAARPLYNQAFSEGIAPESFDDLSRFMRDPIGQEALQKGMRVIELEHLARGDAFDPAAFGVGRADDGRWAAFEGEAPNVRLLDAVKRGFDEIVEGFRDPTSMRLNLNQYGRAVNDVRATYRDGLVEASPTYGRALEAWAGPSQSLDAVSSGRRALTTDPDVVNGIASRLSPADLDFFRLGVGRAITDMASDPARAPTAARRLLEDRNMQRRLAAAIPDPAQRAQFASAMQREVEMTAVERTVSPRAGSQTARLTAGGDDMGNDPPGGFLMSMLNTARTGGLMGGVAQGTMNLYRRTQGINSSTADALASRLLNPDQAANSATLQRLIDRREEDMRKALRNALMGNRITRSGSAAASLEAQD